MPPRSLNSESSAVFDSHRKLRPRSSPPTSFAESNGRCAVDWENTETEYAFFLRHLRVDGNSYVAEFPVRGCRPSLRVKYEEVRGSSPACQTQHQRRRYSSGSMTTGSTVATEAKKGCERRRSSIDDDYQIFLNSIKAYGGTMVLEWKNNATVYEQEPKENEDLEPQQEEEPTEEDEVKAIETEESEEEEEPIYLIQMEGASFDNPLESGDQSYFREILQQKPSLFRTELLRLLSKPFDQQEYENLKSLINVRKPVVKYKHLRDESVSYSSKKLGSSYLDHYPDLARRIESTMDDQKKDFLLRGFFFWLKNLSYPGAFRPWIPPMSNHIVIDQLEDEMVLPLQIDLSGRKEVQTDEERMRNNC